MNRIVAILMLTGLLFAGSATPALAHNTLMDSFPRNGATLDFAPRQIQLQFDEPVQDGPGLTRIAVLGPRQDHWESCGVTIDSTTVSVPVRPLGPPGTYTIGWRVLSADGHPVSGQLTFVLTKPGNGTPTPPDELASCAAAAAPAPAPQPESAAGPAPAGGPGIPTALWIAGAANLLCLGVLLALRMGRRPWDEQG